MAAPGSARGMAFGFERRPVLERELSVDHLVNGRANSTSQERTGPNLLVAMKRFRFMGSQHGCARCETKTTTTCPVLAGPCRAMGVGLTASPEETDRHRWLRDRSRSRLQGKARVMVKNLSAEIRGCSEHADLELGWLLLARSDEFTKRLADFSSEAKRRAEALPAMN